MALSFSLKTTGLLLLTLGSVCIGLPVFVKSPRGQFLGNFSEFSGSVFKGIKYGVVSKRFTSATVPDPFTQLVNASTFGPACVQPVSNSIPKVSEDCLYMNIYCPGNEFNSSLPVMLFIHGGGFVDGAGSLYDGAELAVTQQVVVVTINYRLGPLGFLVTDLQDLKGSGGLNGVADQVLALRWVQENIRSFGGNPDEVTVFGESAGALSTCMLVVSPLAKGLMKRAILESGACTGLAWGPKNSSDGRLFSSYFMKSVNATSAVDLQDVERFPESKFNWPIFVPKGTPVAITSVDGWVLPTMPRQLYLQGLVNVEAIALGANSFDGLAPWYSALIPRSTVEFNAFIARTYGQLRTTSIAEAYSPTKYNGSVVAATVQMIGDHDVLCPTWRLASKLADGPLQGRVFVYMYAHLYGLDKSVLSGLVKVGVNSSLWASHAAELYMLFAPVRALSNAHDTFGSFNPPALTRAEVRLARSMQAYWGSFGRTGTPADGNNSTVWPTYNPAAGAKGVLQLSAFSPGIHTINSNYHASQCSTFGEDW